MGHTGFCLVVPLCCRVVTWRVRAGRGGRRVPVSSGAGALVLVW